MKLRAAKAVQNSWIAGIASKAQLDANSPSNCVLWPLARRGSPPLKNTAFAVAIGLILGIAMVWWVRPDTNAGTVFIVVATTLFCFVAGALLTFIGRLFRNS